MRRGLLLAMVAALALFGHLAGFTGTGTAFASSATSRIIPTVMYAPWNANQFTVDIRLENVSTTSMCLTNPDDPGSPQVPCGLGAFDVTVTWDSTKMTYTNISDGGFLASTGRSVQCPVKTSGPGTARLQCVSLGQIPAGPQGSGVIAKLSLHPTVPTYGSTTMLTISDITVTDIKGAQFPATPTPATSTVQFDKCFANIAPSNTQIDFFDVLTDLQHFGEQPPSNPVYDPSGDGKVTFADATYLLRLFGTVCTPP